MVAAVAAVAAVVAAVAAVAAVVAAVAAVVVTSSLGTAADLGHEDFRQAVKEATMFTGPAPAAVPPISSCLLCSGLLDDEFFSEVQIVLPSHILFCDSK